MPHIDTSNTSYGQTVIMNFDNVTIPSSGNYSICNILHHGSKEKL